MSYPRRFSPLKGVTIGMAVLNLFDENYSDHLNFSFANQGVFSRVPVNDPGRNLSIFLQYRF